MKKVKILFTGGGTGGHLFPLIAIMKELRNKSPFTLDMYFIGPPDHFSNELLEKENVTIKRIKTGKIRRETNLVGKIQNFVDIFINIPIGLIQSFYYIFIISPDLVFSKGGHGSIPITIVSRLLQIPIFIHESDIIPGIANQKMNKYALEIFTSFPKTEYFPPEKLIFTGNPVRKELLIPPTNKEIDETLKIETNKPVLFIIGGSQGSERINDLILEIISQLLLKFEVIHQCGINNFEDFKIQSKFFIPKEYEKSYHLFGFMNQTELKCAYTKADIVVSRAGSGSIFEIALFGKPSILIPLPESAQNHQLKNAYYYSDFGATIVMEEHNLTPHLFLQKLSGLINSHQTLKSMSQRAIEFSKPRSAEIIAEYIIEFLK